MQTGTNVWVNNQLTHTFPNTNRVQQPIIDLNFKHGTANRLKLVLPGMQKSGYDGATVTVRIYKDGEPCLDHTRFSSSRTQWMSEFTVTSSGVWSMGNASDMRYQGGYTTVAESNLLDACKERKPDIWRAMP